ncbi:hypothetical protein FA95DRAFT_369658 [Auriscalpium vulgare]|uniref:Uncharacterized protein n=1 Tax=Auriscalpium vulgare TaxID=40419 RepID=A0ACB8RHA0_9AGAM|nr:hypothetical protein FA95DRAFT_369658 [Auriscalpium vulgare]
MIRTMPDDICMPRQEAMVLSTPSLVALILYPSKLVALVPGYACISRRKISAKSAESKTDTIPGVAKRSKACHQPWALIVVDENYGEGSASAAADSSEVHRPSPGRLHA